MLPHASQFFAMPETEDRDPVERVRATAAEIGARLKALAPELWIVLCGHFRLTPPQRTALLGLDTQALVKMGVHPLVALLADMQVERQRKS